MIVMAFLSFLLVEHLTAAALKMRRLDVQDIYHKKIGRHGYPEARA